MRKLTVILAGKEVKLYGHPPTLHEIQRQLEKPKRKYQALDTKLRDKRFVA